MEKYTVIIPTRDRAETLEATLRTCLRQTYQNFEIIISDNVSSDNTKEIVARFADDRIKYINPGHRLSMTGNFEFALGHVTDGFVMFIGSDDGLMPDAINYVDSLVRKFNVEAVSCQQATYVWPNFPDASIAGRLVFDGLKMGIEIRDPKVWIQKALDFQSHYCFDLPNLYCGFVHKRVIDRAYKDGRYFRSITPDAYAAFATAICIDRYAFSFRPFVIAGASVKSNGAAALHAATDTGESKKFYSENDIEFAKGFVNCPSFEVILAETFAKLAQAFPEQCAAYRINYKAMLQNALKNTNSKTVDDVSRAVALMAQNFSAEINGAGHAPKISGYRLSNKFLRILLNFIRSDRVIKISNSAQVGINDVNDAALAAHVLRCRGEADNFVSTRSSYLRRLKQIIGL
jgi:glycosyltransferase involved in cell wall biosynthesis